MSDALKCAKDSTLDAVTLEMNFKNNLAVNTKPELNGQSAKSVCSWLLKRITLAWEKEERKPITSQTYDQAATQDPRWFRP